MVDQPRAHVIFNPRSFWEAARWQRTCAVCKHPGRFHAHHVVPRQLLRRLRLPENDTRNALRLCDPPGMGGCHMQFEHAGPGKIAVPVAKWKDENVCYAFEVLGVTVVQLEKKYGPIMTDPRWVAHDAGECALCQE